MRVDPARNFAKVTLPLGYDETALVLTLAPGHGSEFPDPAVDGEFNLIWWNALVYPDPSDDPNVEIVRCTSRIGDVLTIIRAQENTLAVAHNDPGGSYNLMLGFTKKMYDDLVRLEVPINPSTSYQTSADLPAGGSVALTTDEASNKRLFGFLVWSSIAYKCVLTLVEGDVESAVKLVGGGQAYSTFQWTAPNPDFITIGTQPGLDAFRLTITNLDDESAGDVYATFFYAD